MISTKKQVQQLVSLLFAKGITNVVISPGSRNGPLIHTLASSAGFHCRSIVDERSAGYFAIGWSQALQMPVALVCSSGTAALNYAPAVAEAFYLGIPLIILTADRPDYWIDQGENQTIRQRNIYKDFCKKEITLPLNESEKELWFAGRIINEALNAAIRQAPGPVHINIPLEEPLHDLVEVNLPQVKVIGHLASNTALPAEELVDCAAVINGSHKILIVAGQMAPHRNLEELLARFSEKCSAVVIREHLSNLFDPAFLESVDILISSLLSEKIDDFKPDLLITLGGTLVSTPLKQFLRKHPPQNHWHVSQSGQYYDTYQSLTKVIEMKASTFFAQLLDPVNTKDQSFRKSWQLKEQQVKLLRDELVNQADYCDLTIFSTLMKSLPRNSIVHLGNSSAVRYAHIFDTASKVHYYGNRGTSGIDGSLSTAVGYASASHKINTIILGDLSFFYDSNALWNNYTGSNLRIIVIHNGGGNIFSMIKGPGESTAFNDYFFTANRVNAAGIACTFGLDYYKAENTEDLKSALNDFYSENQKKAALLEIFSNAELNSLMFRELFKRVKDV